MSKYRAWKSFEREIARGLQSIDPTAIRNIEECRKGSHDIENSLGLAIQCKHGLSPNPLKALTEAKKSKKGMPLAVIRKDKFGTVAVLYWKDFLKVLKYAHNGGLGHKEFIQYLDRDSKRKLAMQKTSLKYKKDSERLSSDLEGSSDNPR